MTTTGYTIVEFEQIDTFAAWRAALDFCKQMGISVGTQCAGKPVGLMWGDVRIAKWRNLSKREIAELDGTIVGDRRGGPLVLKIKARESV